MFRLRKLGVVCLGNNKLPEHLVGLGRDGSNRDTVQTLPITKIKGSSQASR